MLFLHARTHTHTHTHTHTPSPPACVKNVLLQLLQDGSLQIRVSMAAVIPGPFGLVLSYMPSDPSHQSFGTYVTQLSDLSFADVQEVVTKIPQQKLPTTFNSFSVKVALTARGVQGDPSNDSNIISKHVSNQCFMWGAFIPGHLLKATPPPPPHPPFTHDLYGQ